MLRIELQRALDPEVMTEAACGICGVSFVVGSVVAKIVDDGPGEVCPACLEHLHQRNPDAFPSREELEEALSRYPTPVWSTVEEPTFLSAECPTAFWRAYDASWLTTTHA